MSVVTLLSAQMTNRNALPRVANNPAAVAGALRAFAGSVETGAADDIASVYRIGQVPSNAIMHALRLYSDDIGTTATADVGLYRTTQDGGAVVDQDLFATALDIHSGAVNGTDILNESGTFDIAKCEQPLWQVLGLSADPKVIYDICFTLTAATDASATVALRGFYAQ